MTREEALAAWAPDGSPWSRWTKPVLFAFMPAKVPAAGAAAPPAVEAAWPVPLLEDTALVVDLPGVAGVELGCGLARSGYRPVPLYNALPYSPDRAELEANIARLREPSVASARVWSAVDVVPIMRALEVGTAALGNLTLPPSAPPAFLLDADRHHPETPPDQGWFDNRSIVRETDLPTAAFLQAQGIRRIVVIRLADTSWARDLRRVLWWWQEGGLTIMSQTPSESWHPRDAMIAPLSWLTRWWDACVLSRDYPLNKQGSFGMFSHGAGG